MHGGGWNSLYIIMIVKERNRAEAGFLSAQRSMEKRWRRTSQIRCGSLRLYNTILYNLPTIAIRSIPFPPSVPSLRGNQPISLTNSS